MPLWSTIKSWFREMLHGETTPELYKLAERAGAARLEQELARVYWTPQEQAYMKSVRAKILNKPKVEKFNSPVEWTMLREAK